MDLTFLSGVFASPWDIFRNLLDISIVSYIFYRLLGIIRGTRAEQLLKGLVILLVFSAVVSYLKLDMMNWLLQKVWIVFAITLPIVFQPELRRVLEQLGRGRFFARSTSDLEMENYHKIIGELADAAQILSRNKIGALVVVSRETGIGEYLESGVAMDSLVSSALLINIFVPNTPLHDGAVIIKDGRIEKAACILPLSDSLMLDPGLGTRHRAGIGITEVSDALSIIISEETGVVSLAQNGNIERYLDAPSLKDMLYKKMLFEEKKKDVFWKRWWSGNERKNTGE